jgi:hypothetical protein
VAGRTIAGAAVIEARRSVAGETVAAADAERRR